MLALLIAIIVVVLVPLLRRSGVPAGRPRIATDELVKDPVCGTYVVRSRAVRRGSGAEAPYFCSAECAGRFAG